MRSNFLYCGLIALVAATLCSSVGCGESKPKAPESVAVDEQKPAPVAEPTTPPAESKPEVAKETAASPTPPSSAAPASGTPATGDWGTLKGRFVFDGTPPAPKKIDVNKDPAVCSIKKLVYEDLVVDAKGGIANVVVYCRDNKVKVNPALANAGKETVKLDNKDCQFVPHVLGLLTGQQLEVHNSDPIPHNTNIASFSNGGFNPLIAAGGKTDVKFGAADSVPAKVTCNIHPWMSANVLIRPNPYFAISGTDGSFAIKDLPTGSELEFQVWQENVGYVLAGKTSAGPQKWVKGRFKMTIKPGDNDLGDIHLSGDMFKK